MTRRDRLGPVWRVVLTSLIAVLAVAGSATEGQAQSDTGRGAGDSAEEFLGDLPWYDAEKGGIRSVPVVSRTDDSVNRDSRWLPKPKKLKQKKTTTAPAGGGPALTGGGSGGVSFLAWVLIAVLIVVLVALIIFAFTKADIQFGNEDLARKKGRSGDKPDADLLERIKELPAELRRTDVNVRDEAYRLMQLGQFDLAIILLFSHQLLSLDHAGYLRLSRGKTNGRYVREVRRRDRQCANWLRETATAFERSYFGHHSVDADWFDRLWQQNLQMESSISGQQEGAA